MSPHNPSRLRQEIYRLRKQRDRIENALLQKKRMIRASFLIRYLGTKSAKRRKPAYYLSSRREGKTILHYVSAKGHQKIRAKADAWGEYVKLVAEWVKLSRQIEKCFRQLGEAQAVLPGKQRGGDGQP